MAYTTNPPTHGRKPPCYGPHGGIGDVGGDGRVGYDDLAMLKQASLNDITLSEKEASRADLDGNDRPADAVDIAAITRYLVNDLETFPACTKHGYPTTPPTYGRDPPCYGPHGGIGDIGGDGRVDATDLAMVQQAFIGDITLSEKEASRADLDGNGKPADAVDVAAMIRFSVGDLETFPVCGVTPTPTPPTQPNMETRTVSLTEGQHTIQVSFNGYDTLNATINVSATGVTCVIGPCNTQGPPGVTTSGWTVTTYLKTASVISDVCSWVDSIGGWRNLQWSSHVLEAYYVYIGATGHSVGFSPVTWNDVLGLYYYYINDPTAGNGKIGCGT